MKQESTSRRPIHLHPVPLLVGLLAGAGLWLAVEQGAGNAVPEVADTRELVARLEALEKQNQSLTRTLSSRGFMAAHGSGRATSAASAAKYEHERRLLEDPEYAEDQERKRLSALEAEFQSEPVSLQWAAENSLRVETAMAYAAKGAGLDNFPANVDCRSSQCRVRATLPTEVYDDFLTYYSVASAGTLSKSRITTIPRGDGTYEVSIFSSVATNQQQPDRG